MLITLSKLATSLATPFYEAENDLISVSLSYGRFVEKTELTEFKQSDYACGMFVFRKRRA